MAVSGFREKKKKTFTSFKLREKQSRRGDKTITASVSFYRAVNERTGNESTTCVYDVVVANARIETRKLFYFIFSSLSFIEKLSTRRGAPYRFAETNGRLEITSSYVTRSELVRCSTGPV